MLCDALIRGKVARVSGLIHFQRHTHGDLLKPDAQRRCLYDYLRDLHRDATSTEDVSVQFLLGQATLFGIGAQPFSPDIARQFFEKAIFVQHAASRSPLAKLHELGRAGWPKNRDCALALYQVATVQGYVEAATANLALIHRIETERQREIERNVIAQIAVTRQRETQQLEQMRLVHAAEIEL